MLFTMRIRFVYILLFDGGNTGVHNGKIGAVTILSDQGLHCSIINPWKGQRVQISSSEDETWLSGEKLTFDTKKGVSYTLTPKNK